MNSVMSLIRSNDLIFEGSKKRKHTEVGVFSLRVDPERFELSSKQGINKLSTKFRNYLVVGIYQA